MPGGARDDADRATIRRITSEILAAVNTSDHERLLAVWADDGVLMPPNRPAVQGREALERHFREVFTERRFRFSFTLGDVQLAVPLPERDQCSPPGVRLETEGNLHRTVLAGRFYHGARPRQRRALLAFDRGR